METFSILQLGLSINPLVLPPLNTSNWAAWSSLVEDLLVHCKYALAVLQGSRDDVDIDRELFTFFHLHIDPSLRHLMFTTRNTGGRSGRRAYQLLKHHCAVNQSITPPIKEQIASEWSKGSKQNSKEEFAHSRVKASHVEAPASTLNKQGLSDKRFTSSDLGHPSPHLTWSSLAALEHTESIHERPSAAQTKN